MTDTTPNLALPELIAAQAQKHVTVNEALRALDVLVQLAVLDRDLAAPPASPAEGQRWLIAAGPTGDWAGHAQEVAAWQDGGWEFYAPQVGWLAYVMDEGALLTWTGSAWVDAIDAFTSLNNMTLLGVGTTADATNPFSAKLNNVLWVARALAQGGDGDLRWKMSKEGAANTLSMLFQTGFSGRAEIGLTGDDDFHIKVSSDGTAWNDAVVIDRSTGGVTIAGASGRLRSIARFSASGTYTKPGWLKFAVVRCVGAGGGGGGATQGTGASAGGGGGGGGYAEKRLAAAAIGTTETVTVGAAGSSGTAGNNAGGTGGTSSFGAHVSASGGTGGSGSPNLGGANAVAGGAGGTGSGGDANQSGQGGGNGLLFAVAGAVIAIGGHGGGSRLGAGAPLRGTVGNTAGATGTGPGAGGSGASCAQTGSSQAGGNGYAGYAEVWEFE